MKKLEDSTTNLEVQSLREVVVRLRERGPDTTLITFDSNSSKTVSACELIREIEKFESAFSTRDLGAGDRLLLLAQNNVQWIAASLACFEIGAVIVPVDAQLDDAALKHIVQDANPKIIFTTADMKMKLNNLLPLMSRSYLLPSDLNEPQKDIRSIPVRSKIGPDDIAAIFYTSGTTGLPKGVPLSVSNLVYQVNSVIRSNFGKCTDRVLLPLPFHHIYPFSLGLLCPLFLQIPIILPYQLTGPHLLRAIKEGNATIIIGVPRLYSALYSAIETRIEDSGKVISSYIWCVRKLSGFLRAFGCGSITKSLLKPLHDKIGPSLRLLTTGGAALDPRVASGLESLGWKIVIGYGLTETSPLICLKLPDDHRLTTVGTVLPGTELRLDTISDKLKETAGELGQSGCAGEIQVKGPGVFAGYLNMPEKNADAFTNDGWFRTGDMGCIEDGHLRVLGRVSSLIVSESGKKIDPEVLEAFYSEHPLIEEIGILSKQGKLVAVVVPKLDSLASLNVELNRIMHDAIDERSLHLPTYKRLAGYVLSKEKLERTPMDKIMRYKLAAKYDSIICGDTAKSSLLDSADVLLPGIADTPAAMRTIKCLQKRYGNKSISLNSNLQLDLGIDSLEWIELSLDIEQISGIRLDQDAISKIRTVKDLLKEVTNNHSARAESSTSRELEPTANDLRWLAPLSNMEKLFQYALESTVAAVMKTFFRVKVEGSENISRAGNVIFVPNHASYIDAFALGTAIGRTVLQNVYWAGWTGIAFANDLACKLSRLGHVIPIDADRALVSSLALAIAVLRRGKSLVWFPEGRRSLTGEVLPFRPGVGFLFQRYPTTIVPVYLKNTAKALPPGSFLPRPYQITVSFGKPITPEEIEREIGMDAKPDEIAAFIRKQVVALRPDQTQSASVGILQLR